MHNFVVHSDGILLDYSTAQEKDHSPRFLQSSLSYNTLDTADHKHFVAANGKKCYIWVHEQNLLSALCQRLILVHKMCCKV
jgi:hypothetical protein